MKFGIELFIAMLLTFISVMSIAWGANTETRAFGIVLGIAAMLEALVLFGVVV